MLISTKPDTKGKEAVLKRSLQLTEFYWTPLKEVPVFIKKVGKTVLPAGVEQKGMLYSSTEPTDTFITENVSFETFLSIIENPDSALYQKDLNGHNNSWAYFGLVCNGMVRYAMNIRRRYSTKRWADVPGMRKIADQGTRYAEQMELCDVLYAYGEGRNHVALITDILKDESGVIREIEVSEGVRPICKRARYEVERFYEIYRLFALWRYDFVDEVPMPDEKDVAVLLESDKRKQPVVAVDHGNKANYRLGDPVVISVFGEGIHTLEVFHGEEKTEVISLVGTGKVSREFPQGYYRIRHMESGEWVEFCICAPMLTHHVEQDTLVVQADPCDAQSRILYMEFREPTKKELQGDGDHTLALYYSDKCSSLAKVEELSEEEIVSGRIVRKIPADGAHYKVYFENKYGVWTHQMVRIS